MVQKALGTAVNRRRFIQIIGAVGAGALLPVAALAETKAMSTWSGISLGADADIQLFYPNKPKAHALLRACLSEITRLEGLFSLYKADSVINQLNQNGMVKQPAREFVELLKQARQYSEMSGGAFDITVQTQLAHNTPMAAGRIDYSYKQLHVQDDAVFFAKPAIQITLNGIAQGYITDKVTALLRAEGVEHALVSLGEKHAIGGHPNGRNWHVGLVGSHGAIELNNQASATSSHADYQHIIDPSTGRFAQPKPVTVIADSATKADALSTAYAVMGRSGVVRV